MYYLAAYRQRHTSRYRAGFAVVDVKTKDYLFFPYYLKELVKASPFAA